jgi:hypothetical protein
MEVVIRDGKTTAYIATNGCNDTDTDLAIIVCRDDVEICFGINDEEWALIENMRNIKRNKVLKKEE